MADQGPAPVGQTVDNAASTPTWPWRINPPRQLFHQQDNPTKRRGGSVEECAQQHPPMRGNHLCCLSIAYSDGAIPAHAGKPRPAPRSGDRSRVYPRPCGETRAATQPRNDVMGLSPPMRGNRGTHAIHVHNRGSIPAHAGKPSRRWTCTTTSGCSRRTWVFWRGRRAPRRRRLPGYRANVAGDPATTPDSGLDRALRRVPAPGHRAAHGHGHRRAGGVGVGGAVDRKGTGAGLEDRLEVAQSPDE